MAHQDFLDLQDRTDPRDHKANKDHRVLKVHLVPRECQLFRPDVVMQCLYQPDPLTHRQYTDPLVLQADQDPPDYLDDEEDKEHVVGQDMPGFLENKRPKYPGNVCSISIWCSVHGNCHYGIFNSEKN
jgi:hypothetical protein